MTNDYEMKHLLLVGLFVACALCAYSQQVNEVYLPSAGTSSCVIREGDTYWCEGQSMNKRAFRQFLLASDYMPAYERFQSGYRMAVAGWSILGTGLGLSTVGIGFFCAGFGHLLFPPDDTVMGVVAGSAALIVCSYLGVLSLFAGGVLDVVSIPLLCVGYARMHQSVEVYNVRCRAPQNRVTMGVRAGGDGIGLALRF